MTTPRRADLAILGGLVVTPGGARRVGVAIEAGRIVSVGPEQDLPPARESIDPSGALVLPGAIDVHLHYDRDGRLADRVGDATRSGACGGVTSAVAFLLWQPGRRPADTLEEAIAEVEAESFLDLGFHFYLRANDVDALSDVAVLVERGVSSFKMAMAYKRRGMMCSDEFLLAAMAAIGRAGGMALVHAEVVRRSITWNRPRSRLGHVVPWSTRRRARRIRRLNRSGGPPRSGQQPAAPSTLSI